MGKNTLVLGASMNTRRYSNIAIRKLIAKKNETFAVGNKKGSVLDVEIFDEKHIFENIDTVALYLNPVKQKEYYDYILALNPKRVIFNPGTENTELMKLLKEHNIEVEIACALVMLNTGLY